MGRIPDHWHDACAVLLGLASPTYWSSPPAGRDRRRASVHFSRYYRRLLSESRSAPAEAARVQVNHPPGRLGRRAAGPPSHEWTPPLSPGTADCHGRSQPERLSASRDRAARAASGTVTPPFQVQLSFFGSSHDDCRQQPPHVVATSGSDWQLSGPPGSASGDRDRPIPWPARRGRRSTVTARRQAPAGPTQDFEPEAKHGRW